MYKHYKKMIRQKDELKKKIVISEMDKYIDPDELDPELASGVPTGAVSRGESEDDDLGKL